MRELKSLANLVKSSKTSSHPTWMRELKFDIAKLRKNDIESHPTWMRELKLQLVRRMTHQDIVASYMDA